MERCCYCNRRIEGLDFYMGTAKGRVCSNCLVLGRAFGEDLRALPRPRNSAFAPASAEEMSLEELHLCVFQPEQDRSRA